MDWPSDVFPVPGGPTNLEGLSKLNQGSNPTDLQEYGALDWVCLRRFCDGLGRRWYYCFWILFCGILCENQRLLLLSLLFDSFSLCCKLAKTDNSQVFD